MEADWRGSPIVSQISGSLSVRSETIFSGKLTDPFPDGLCPRCQDLKIGDRHLQETKSEQSVRVPYSLEDSLPGLPVLSRSIQHGCNFCELLKSIIIEFVSNDQQHQWLETSLLAVDSKATWSPIYTFLPDAGLSYFQLPVSFRKLPHLEERAECFIHFEVESTEGNSGNGLNITRRPLEPHLLSENNVAKFKSWLHQCHAEHEDCQHDKTTKRLPTRLVAVGGGPLNESPRIIVCSENPTLMDCEQTPYIALSHCWGKGVMLMKTERCSLSDRMACIPLETMPRTYHDAVLLTRSLGISYLWINSLCIVQDDKDDWKREAASMAEVYQNVNLTICALVTSCNDGLFRGNREPGVRITEEHGEYFLRHGAVVLWDGTVTTEFRRSYKDIKLCDNMAGSSWSSRGWTFQEELFSTRRLMCSERLIYLDCNMASCSENSILGKAFSKSLPSRLRNDHADLFSTWYNLMSSYSRRSLTYEQDRLPAISSLAASFAELIEGQYIAGLWKNDLPHGLLWHRTDDEEGRLNLSDLVKRRTCKSHFIAPSWSWAREGHFSEWPHRSKQNFAQYKVLEAWSETDSINPFGSITSARLVVEGKLRAVSHISLFNMYEEYCYAAESSGDALGQWYLDFDPFKDDVVDWTEEWEDNRAFMFILTKGVSSDSKPPVESLSGLLLYPTGCENEYIRIGTFSKVCGFGKDGYFTRSLLPDFLEDAPYHQIRLI